MGFKFGNGFYTSVRVAKDQSYKRNTSNFRKGVLHTYLKMILMVTICLISSISSTSSSDCNIVTSSDML